jgi:methylated-DNA-[protein]-cysteine S-methyltransferase
MTTTSTTTVERFCEAPDRVFWEAVASPLGEFLLAGDGATLVAARLPGSWTHDDVPRAWTQRRGAMGAAAAQLAAYFAGTRRAFELEFAPNGTTFQRSVWDALCTIPYGTTASYGDVARRIDKPRATRAVGLANNRNPIALFIPCHRVIGANGSLTGYGGGLEMKSWLLDHEHDVAARR